MGYTAAAEIIGVSVSHLWHVLNGTCTTPRTLDRYRKMILKGGGK